MEFLNNRQDLRGVDIAKEWRLLMTEDEIQIAVKKCADFINENFNGKDIVIACILKGAAYFLVDLTRKLTIPHSVYFIEASSYKDEQQQENNPEILSNVVASKFENKITILIDELFDNGTTMEDVKNHIHKSAKIPLDSIFTMALFKKNKPDNNYQLDYYGILLHNVWLVGYGLDDKQEKRNWPNLWACPKTESIPKTEDDMIFSSQEHYEKARQEIVEQLKKITNK